MGETEVLIGAWLMDVWLSDVNGEIGLLNAIHNLNSVDSAHIKCKKCERGKRKAENCCQLLKPQIKVDICSCAYPVHILQCANVGLNNFTQIAQ